VTDTSGSLGRGGYEGVQNDSAGNLWIVEDSGGPAKNGTTAKRPNSFLYRYVPARPVRQWSRLPAKACDHIRSACA
jgi:hypothetical protein